MANPFEILVSNLNALGFFGFLLPWIFTFAVLFGLLLKAKTFGDNKRIIGVISLVVAFFVTGFGGPVVASFFANLFGLASIVLAGILVIALFLAMSGTDIGKITENKAIVYAIVGIGIVVFFTAAGALGIRISDSTIAIIFMLLILIVAIAFITK